MKSDPVKRLPRQTLDTLEAIVSPITVEIIQRLSTILLDADEVAAWLHTPNGNFDGASPIEVIVRGSPELVLEFINESIAKNFIVTTDGGGGGGGGHS